jgi:uncharacterized membrane protein YecN with MAPEG domain
MKPFLILFLLFIPLALLYAYLDAQWGGSWWAVAVIALILLVCRVLWYSKKTK